MLRAQLFVLCIVPLSLTFSIFIGLSLKKGKIQSGFFFLLTYFLKRRCFLKTALVGEILREKLSFFLKILCNNVSTNYGTDYGKMSRESLTLIRFLNSIFSQETASPAGNCAQETMIPLAKCVHALKMVRVHVTSSVDAVACIHSKEKTDQIEHVE